MSTGGRPERRLRWVLEQQHCSGGELGQFEPAVGPAARRPERWDRTDPTARVSAHVSIGGPFQWTWTVTLKLDSEGGQPIASPQLVRLAVTPAVPAWAAV